MSGSPANHYTQFASVEAVLPVAPAIGVGTYAGWYQRRSSYRGQLGEATTFPELRAFLTWHPGRVAPLGEGR